FIMNIFKENNRSDFQLTDQLISHYQIPFRSFKKETLDTILDKINKQEQNKKREVKAVTWYIRSGIAAAALIAALITLYFFTATVRISSGQQDVIICRLPEMSRVVLHRNSSIKYSKYFWRGNTELTGTAYFEVNRGGRFRVNTEHGSVEVLGTRFMVDSENRKFNVECYQGSVKTVYLSDTSILESGTKFTGSLTGVTKERIENNEGYPEFAVFREKFSNASLTSVFDKMENFFGVTIDVEKGITKNFSGTIQTGNLESALEIVCESLQLKFKMTDKVNIQVYN
ncbi:MAG: FecR family protein, partial [Prolixibacteraceae bacterium]|nr:FecR family protein [Prolixibacteraceae bacterium]